MISNYYLIPTLYKSLNLKKIGEVCRFLWRNFCDLHGKSLKYIHHSANKNSDVINWKLNVILFLYMYSSWPQEIKIWIMCSLNRDLRFLSFEGPGRYQQGVNEWSWPGRDGGKGKGQFCALTWQLQPYASHLLLRRDVGPVLPGLLVSRKQLSHFLEKILWVLNVINLLEFLKTLGRWLPGQTE